MVPALINQVSRMLKINGLTNHLYMLAVLVMAVLLPLVINAALEIIPIRHGLQMVVFSLFCVHGVWLILLAHELNVLGPRKRYALILAAVALFIAFSGYLLFATNLNLQSSVHNEVARAVTVASLCVTFSLSALIADRISNSRGSMILNFWFIMNWPFFLFIVAPSIRCSVR